MVKDLSKDPSWLFREASSLLGKRSYTDALRKLNEYLKLAESNKDIAAGHNLRGLILMELKRYGDASTAFEEAIGLEPEDSLKSIFWCNDGIAHLKLGELDAAIDLFGKAIDLDNENNVAWYNKGAALIEQGNAEVIKGAKGNANEKFEGAVECFDIILEKNKKHADALNKKGLALIKRGWLTEGMAMITNAIKINPEHADALLNMGIVHFNANNYSEAKKCFERLLKIDPENRTALYKMGLILEEKGDFKRTYEYLKKALELAEWEDDAELISRIKADLARLKKIKNGGAKEAPAQPKELLPPIEGLAQALIKLGPPPEPGASLIKEPTIPNLANGNKLVLLGEEMQCNFCLKAMKSDTWGVECSCGKMYHIECTAELGKCRKCGKKFGPG